MTLDQLPLGSIRAVFTDLDDTLTDHSKISADTYRSLWQLKEAGLWLVVVSGRPAGWADALMRLWPIDCMIFENGAGICERDGKKIRMKPLAEMSTRESQQKKLETIFVELQKEFPAIKPATDQFYRLFDYTIDFREEPPELDADTVEALLERLKAWPEVTAKLSSIHINFWIGKHTKVTACERLLREHNNISKEHVVFIGDSPNDEPLFEYFPNAVGVANVMPFLGRMKSKPKFITEKKGGHGFQELARCLLSPP